MSGAGAPATAAVAAPGVARLRLAGLLVVAIVLQTTFATDLRVDGVAPDLMLLAAVAAGLVGGPGTGAVVGFGAGLLADLATTSTPVGLAALAWCLTGCAVGALRDTVLPEGRALWPLVGLLATAGGVVVYLLVAGLAGQTTVTSLGQDRLARIVVVESVWNAVLIAPVAALVDRAARGLRPTDRLLPAGRPGDRR